MPVPTVFVLMRLFDIISHNVPVDLGEDTLVYHDLLLALLLALPHVLLLLAHPLRRPPFTALGNPTIPNIRDRRLRFLEVEGTLLVPAFLPKVLVGEPELLLLIPQVLLELLELWINLHQLLQLVHIFTQFLIFVVVDNPLEEAYEDLSIP
mmetsp:Transcript_39785/g.38338  ORF Transcript_39785/g.38338 Transcript_39785/m.38338 type:complete len:151 (-) Transcript_39785:927-1379(-)